MSINELFLNPPRGIIDHSSSEMKKRKSTRTRKVSSLYLDGEKRPEGRLTEAKSKGKNLSQHLTHGWAKGGSLSRG